MGMYGDVQISRRISGARARGDLQKRDTVESTRRTADINGTVLFIVKKTAHILLTTMNPMYTKSQDEGIPMAARSSTLANCSPCGDGGRLGCGIRVG